MSFSDHYFTEAKLSVARQFLNLFSKEKKININLDKDLVYFSEINARGFHDINSTLSRSYTQHKELGRRKKTLKSRGEDKILARMSQKKSMDIEAGPQIINVFNVNLKGGLEKISPYNSIQAAAAYETGRGVVHYGYIVMIITESLTNDLKYYIGADRLGLKFFKEKFGTNMDMYVAANRPSEVSTKGKTEAPKKKEKEGKSVYGVIDIQGPNEFKEELWKDIKESWGTARKDGTMAGNFINIQDGKVGDGIGYQYTIEPLNPEKHETSIGVYIGGPKKNKKLIIVFYDGEYTIDVARNLKLFDKLESIKNPQNQIYQNIKKVNSLQKI